MLVFVLSIARGAEADLGADPAVEEALATAALTPADLEQRTDYELRDAFRLPLVEALLTRPLTADSVIAHLRAKLAPDRPLSALLEVAVDQLGLGDQALGLPQEPEGPPGDFWTAHGRLLRALASARGKVANAFSGLTEAELAALREELPPLLLENDVDPGDTHPVELRALRLAEADRAAQLFALAGRARRETLAAAGLEVVLGVEAFLAAVEGTSGVPSVPKAVVSPASFDVSGDVIAAGGSGESAWAIGGPGPTVYARSLMCIVDLGGDDRYHVAAGRTGGVTTVLDLGGDDRYDGSDRGGPGTGLFGVDLLVDRTGDDAYLGGDLGCGVGLMGVGLLLDEAGDDRYAGGSGVQGMGYLGVGLLVDRAGDDTYRAGFFAQGVGFVGGLGALLDGGGDDLYRILPAREDDLREAGHALSMSQGFGFGHRPRFSGGVGWLYDASGNDIYEADVYGQGSAYWYAFGALVDGAGEDAYIAGTYAQGAGVHLAVGALADRAGDDTYRAVGVSQGCGHDRSFGLLLDEAGDDSYVARALSQGAGNANGHGLLLDRAGNDAYLVREPERAQGYGNFRRERGSIGLLLDLGGRDSYAGAGADTSLWGTGRHGIGLDR